LIAPRMADSPNEPSSEPVGTLQTALTHAARMLAERPAMAEAQAREILKVIPAQADALLLLAQALRVQGRAEEALEAIAPVAAGRPDWAPAQLERGLVLAALGESAAAIEALRLAVRLDPRRADAWRELGEQLNLIGDSRGADQAQAQQIKASVSDPRLLEAADALVENRLAVAEHILRDHLKRHPTDIAAIRMFAEVGGRLGRYDDAEALLERCLELAPGFTAARRDYASVLHRQNKTEQALAEIEVLLAQAPAHPGYRSLRAAALTRIGEYAQAIDIYDHLLKRHPDQPKAQMSYGHALKTVGRQGEAVAAYRKAVELQPHLGEAWWSLANLKTVSFSEGDIAAMRGELAKDGLGEEDRFHLEFALGKALEDQGSYADSFGHYRAGNELRRAALRYEADETADHKDRSIALFTPAFFAERAGVGSQAPDPIFVVGLPRAGSTLIEQILASHSQVEGTMELHEITAMARRLGGRRKRGDDSAYPEAVADLSPDELRAMGEEYLERTRVQRKTEKPFFIDKLPNNFAHLGLIRLILPNAKVIDARRHPMACGFSLYKQHFARGQSFSYDLTDIGRYYRDYVALMAHFDQALPGWVHRVIHEELVADPEGRTRALLAHCGLEFEDACLRFYETERAVRTASSEQVRRPISTEGLDQWRNYEPWLDELRDALGPIAESYPAIP
jgi:tetratricopeptide (TPR) repeat protein